MAKKKTVLWGRVLGFFGTVLMLFVVFLASTNRLPSTTFVRSLLKPRASVTKPLNILEIRYYPVDPTGQETQTAALSSLLQSGIAEASRPKGYKDAAATAVVTPVVKNIVRRNKNTPYTTGTGETWYESLKTILTGDGADLCSYITANNIDQVWIWKYVPSDNGGFNQERFRSWSNTMLPTGGYPPLCNGQRSFLVLGLSQTDGIGSALHTFGHSVEDTIPILEGDDLFWTKWTGGANGDVEARTCGNVHFPPNTGTAYDYTRSTYIQTNCEDWHADRTGATTNVVCSRWGCSQDGYMKWWLQNMPNSSQGLTYNGKVIPTWWEFLADTDNAIRTAAASGQWLTPQYAAMAAPGPVSTATPYPGAQGVAYRCTPQQPATATCNSNSTTCGKTCIDSSGTTVATCAAGSDCLPQACHPVGNSTACTGTMSKSCGWPCRSNSDCSTGSECVIIAPANQQVLTYHTVRLVNKPNGSANMMIVDAVKFYTDVLEETDGNLSYSGAWTATAVAGTSGGNIKYTSAPGAYVEFTTQSANIVYIGAKQPSLGNVEVYVDGVLKTTLSQTSSSVKLQQQYDLSSYLGGGSNPAPTPTNTPAPTATPAPTVTPMPAKTVKLVNKPTGSGTASMDFDAIVEDATTTPILTQETSNRFTYSGTWVSTALSSVSGGTTKSTSTSGAYVQFATTKSSLYFIGASQYNLGSVDVYVNGVFKGNIVMTSSANTKQTPYNLSSYLQ